MADKKAKDDKKEDKKEELKADAKKAPGAEGEAAPAEGAEGEEGAEGGSGKKKIIIIAGAAVVLLLAIGAGLYFTGVLDKMMPGHKVDCAAVKEGDKDYAACAEQAAKGASGMTPGIFVQIPDLIVNLNGNTKQPHFLKIAIKVELETKEDEKPFNEVMPRIIDQFQTYLRELRMEDLRGSAGLYRMKLELLNRVRAAALEVKVRDVLFQEILVQ